MNTKFLLGQTKSNGKSAILTRGFRFYISREDTTVYAPVETHGRQTIVVEIDNGKVTSATTIK